MQSKYHGHGTVTLESFRGRLRLRLPRSLYEGKQVRISLGLTDTEENRAIAEEKRAVCERDIKLGMFDETHNKYKPGTHLTIVETLKPKEVPKLDELWEKFIEFKRPQCSPSTMQHQYKAFTSHLKRLPTYDLDRASEIRDWCVANLTIDTCKRFLVRLNACCEWAMKSGMIQSNPFTGMAKDIKVPKSQKSGDDNDINPFTAEERDRILEAVQTNRFCSKYSRVKHSFYYPYVWFLFNTGTRPSEAIALEWRHISSDFRLIQIEQSVVDSEDGRVCKEGLKTQDKRKFPCNAKLQEFLRSIKPENCQPNDSLFQSPGGKWIDPNNFRNRIWKPILDGLKLEYRKPYQTRHTFITLALENGLDAKDVAKLVGNSPEVIYKHYAGNKRELFVPEF